MNRAFIIVVLFLVGTIPVEAQEQESSLTYGLVIDCSGSVRKDFPYIVAGASSIVNSNTASDQAFITRFISQDQIETTQDLTSDKTSLLNSIRDLHIEGGQTAIVDGVYFAARYLDDHAAKGRRALVLISDGEDRQSYYTLDVLLTYLRDKQIPVYILAFGYHSPRTLTFINKLAQDSGGKVVFAKTGKELPAKAPELIHQLREGNANPRTQPNKSLNRSGGSVSCIIRDPALLS
jgi:Ca-activated chloride channel homolog